MIVNCLDGILEYNAVIDMGKTISCGQTFRWTADGGAYSGTVGFGRNEKNISLIQDGENMSVSVTKDEFKAFWSGYFDLDTDYGRLDEFAASDGFFAQCLDYGKGIRVLRQDLWETVITFILSQRSNIPRIRSCIGNMVGMFGHFPTPDEIFEAEPDSLSVIRCGYRAPYLKAASEFRDLDRLPGATYDEAKAMLTRIKGVGVKVADCVILFGVHNRGAFPVDVWIERVITAKYSGTLDPSGYGDMAGIVQQYMFFYAINHKLELKK